MPPLLTYALIAVGVLVLLVLLGQHSQAVGSLLSAILAVPATLIHVLHDWADRLSAWLIDQARMIVTRAEEPPEGTWIGMVVIGTLIAAVALAVVFYTDLQLMLMTLPFLGFAMEAFPMPEEAATIVAMSMIALTVYWGEVFCESAGFTRVTPIARRSRRERYWFLGTSVVALAVILYMGVQLAAVRTHETAISSAQLHAMETDPFAAGVSGTQSSAPSAPATPSDATDPVLAIDGVNKALMVLSTVTVFMGKWCIEPLLAYALALLLSLLWVPAMCVRLLLSLAEQLFAAVTDQLVPAALGLSRDITRSGFDWYASLRDPAFEQELDEIAQSASALGQEMADHVVRTAVVVNGHVPEEPAHATVDD